MNPEIKKLFPNYTDQELEEVEQRLKEYVWIVLRVLDYLVADPEAMNRYKELAKLLKKRPPTDM